MDLRKYRFPRKVCFPTELSDPKIINIWNQIIELDKNEYIHLHQIKPSYLISIKYSIFTNTDKQTLLTLYGTKEGDGTNYILEHNEYYYVFTEYPRDIVNVLMSLRQQFLKIIQYCKLKNIKFKQEHHMQEHNMKEQDNKYALPKLTIEFDAKNNTTIKVDGEKIGYIQDIKFQQSAKQKDPLIEITFPDFTKIRFDAQDISKNINKVSQFGNVIIKLSNEYLPERKRNPCDMSTPEGRREYRELASQFWACEVQVGKNPIFKGGAIKENQCALNDLWMPLPQEEKSINEKLPKNEYQKLDYLAFDEAKKLLDMIKGFHR